MKIAVASDHAGYELKVKLSDWLKDNNYVVNDFGTYSIDSCDYPEYAFKAALSVAKKECNYGIIVCGSGIGMSIVCNKVKGIRAANCCSEEMAVLSRKHNNANVLNLGARLMDLDSAINITKKFLNTEFDGGRHSIRVQKIHDLTGL
ncbi:ribose 5-phosphate isomerase B [Bacteroidetes/Chlorobi group bacterium ChocPot_Mid]|nr:MAG: ribose 5-phosphate isomerase B [Bacteroidetes/Chlorobi group bacterium ChocPot_Mid]